MKNSILIIFFLCFSFELFSLPKGEEVTAGQAVFSCEDSKSMKVVTSEKAIINYQDFSIEGNERVEFVQPSEKSCVLNRVRGGDESRILGELNANGRIFLVNPQGVYFGKDAVVDTGSLIVSTLNIKDEDFLQDKYRFFLEPERDNSRIINEGSLSVSEKGFIALFSPFIENHGDIIAKAGKIALLSAEEITLDFSQDGLVQFAVDGDLKQALIENYGKIVSAGGDVRMSVKAASQAVKMVVNTDGITPANTIEEKEGMIRLVCQSSVEGQNVAIESSAIESYGIVEAQKDLTLSADRTINIDSSSLISGKDLSLLAPQKIVMRDSPPSPTIMNSGGKFSCSSDLIDILILSHPESGFMSGGDLTLISSNPICGDAHFKSGGDFALLKPNGDCADFVSFVDPIVSSDSGCRFGSYVGVSLKVEARRRINCRGSITITGPDLTATGDSDSPILTSSAAVIFRAGLDSLEHLDNVPGTYEGTSFVNIDTYGSIRINGDIITAGGPVLLYPNTTNSDSVLLRTDIEISTSGGDITIGGSINSFQGLRTLTLNPGPTGNISVTNSIGDISPLISLTISDVNNATFTDITSGTISQLAGAGTSTFGTISTSAIGGMTLTGTNFLFNDPVTTTAAGPVTINNSGTLTIPSGSNFSVDGDFTQSGAGGVSFSSNITKSSSGLISFAGPVDLAGTSALNSAGGDITFSNTLDGTNPLSLTAGAGNVLISGVAGGGSPLGALSIVSAGNVTTQAITASSISQNAGTGTSSFGVLSTSAVGGISLTGTNFTFNNTVTTASAGPVIINNSGTTTIPVGSDFSVDGVFNQSGAGGVSLSANVTKSSSGLISFAGPVTLGGTIALNSVDGNITLSNTVNGTNALSLTAGAGNILLSGIVGGVTPLGTLNIVSAANVTTQAITASSITQSAGTGTSSFGVLSTSAVGGISLTGTNFTFNNTVTTAAAGPVIINNSGLATIVTGANFSVAGNFTQSGAGSVSLSADITKSLSGPISFAGPVSLAGTSALNSAGGDITFTNTLNGSNALSLTAGAGNILFSATAGGAIPLGDLSFVSATNVTTQAVTASSISQSAGSGTSSFGALSTQSIGGISLTGTNFIFNNTVTTASSGPVTIDNSGALTIPTGSNFSLAGPFNQSGAGAVSLSANIFTSSSGAITFVAPVTLGGTSSLSSAGGDITFSNTLDADIDYNHSITLASDTGNIIFSSAVGSVHPLNNITLFEAVNVTTQALTLSSLTQSAGSGTTIINGVLNTSGVLGIDLTGTAFTFNNTVTASGGGNMSIANSGLLSLPVVATLTLSARLDQTGTGAVDLANSIASGGGISFSGPITLTGSVNIDTSSNNSNMDFSNTIDGGNDLTLTAGSGNIVASTAIGSITRIGAFHIVSNTDGTFDAITAQSLALDASTGTSTFNSNINTNGAAGITLVSNNLTSFGNLTSTGSGSIHVTYSGVGSGLGGSTVDSAGSFLQDGTGSTNLFINIIARGGDITFTRPATLVGNSSFDTSPGGGDVHFASTVDGSHTFSLAAGSGNVIVDGILGGSSPLGAIIVNSAADVTTQAITAASITQNSGTGTTNIQGDINTSGASGISITTNAITRGGAITTTGGGGLTITNSGLFTSTAVEDVHLSGSFVQNGLGPVTISGEIFTEDQPISFASPITLAGDTDLDAGNIGNDITLSSTVNGSFILEFCPVAGDLFLLGDVGTTTRLTTFYIDRIANASIQKVFAQNILQVDGTGTTTFNDALNTNGGAGISLQGVSFVFDDSITTTNTGSLDIHSTGTTTFNSPATGSIDGTVTIHGEGSVILSSSITAAGAVELINAVSISGSASLDTSGANQPITFSNTLDGPGNLICVLGTGNLTMTDSAGGITPLGDVLISSAQNVTTASISAATITQSVGTGTSLFQGAVSSSAVGGISLTGAAFTFSDDVTTTNAGPIAISNSGLLTFSSGKTVSSDSTFSQTDIGGTVSLAGSIITNDADLSFASAVVLTGPSIVSSGSDGGNVTFSSTIDGTVAGLQNITFTSGTGDITCSAALGGITRIGNAIVTSANDVNLKNVTALSVNQQAGTGTSTLDGNINTSGIAGMSFVGANFVRTGDLITTGGGSLTVTNSGTITGTLGNSTNISGSYIQNGTGLVYIGGTIQAQGEISFTSDVRLAADTVFISSLNNITLNGALDSFVSQSHSFTATAGGNVSLIGDAGQSDPIDLFDITAAQNVTTNKIDATSISVGSVTPVTGTTIFSDVLNTSGASGIEVKGNLLNVNANITTTGSGSLTLTNSGLLTIASGVTIDLDGAFSQNGTGGVSSGGDITTNNAAIGFNSSVTMIGNSAYDSGSGGGDITFSDNLDGAYSLGLSAGSGNVIFQDSIGSFIAPSGLTINSSTNVTASSPITVDGPFTIASVTGTATFNDLLTTTTAIGISLTGVAFTFNNGITTTNSGPIAISNSGLVTFPAGKTISSSGSFTQTDVGATGSVSLGGTIVTDNANLSFSSPIVLSSATLLNTGSGAGDITITSTVDGTVAGVQNLTFTAGTGDITVSADLGGTTRLGNTIVSSVNDANLKNLNAFSVAQQSGTGTSTLDGDINTSGIAGMTFVGTNFVRTGDLITTGGGSITVTNSGLMTGTAGNTTNISGSYIQNGTGPVNLGGLYQTQGLISIAQNCTLLANTTLDSSGGNSDITISGTVDGAHSLSLIAGSGHVDLLGNAGSSTPLSALTITGSEVTLEGSVASSGAVLVTGTTQIKDNITTTNSNLSLIGDVTIAGPTLTFSTGLGAGNISISGTVDGDISGRNLILSSGTGSLILSSAVGAAIPFNNFTASANSISLADFGSASPGASGTTSLTASTTIDFNGTTYTNATQVYSAGTFFNFNAGALTTISSNSNNISFNTGTIQLSSSNDLTVNSFGGDITLTPVLVTNDNQNVLTLDAGLGHVIIQQIGAPPVGVGYLTTVDITYGSIVSPLPNIYAYTTNLNSATVTYIGSDVNYAGGTNYNTPVQITADSVTFTRTGGNGSLTFGGSLNGDGTHIAALTFTPNGGGGSDDVIFNGPVGGSNPPGSMAINTADNVNINSSMNVGAFSQTGGLGTTTIVSGITSTAAGGISIATNSISLAGSFVTGSGGDVVFNNSGALTTTGLISVNADGAFQQTGAGTVEICGNITTRDDEISFIGDVTLCETLTLNTVDASGGDISFAGTVNGTVAGNQSIFMTAGSGDISYAGVVGGVTSVGHFEIISAHDVTVDAVSSFGFEQFAGTGTTTINGALSTSSNEGVLFVGSVLTINNSVTTTGNGAISITNSGLLTLTNSANCSVNGSFIQNGAGLCSLAGAITSDGVISFATAASLSSALSLDSSNNDQNTTFSSTLDGPGDFTADVGSGVLTISAIAGNSTRLGDIVISQADDVSTLGIIASSLTQLAGTGTTAINGALNTDTVTGISLTGTAFSMNGDLITTNAGPVAIVNSGSLNLIAGNNTSISALFSQSGGGAVSLGGKILTANQNLSFTNPVTLSSATILSSGTGAGIISFASTVDGNNSLSLTAGTGNITFGGALGSISAIGDFTIVSVADVSYPATRANTITQNASSGTTVISGDVRSLAVGGIDISCGVITQNATISTINEGPVVINNSGLLTIAGDTDSSGPYSQTGAGDVHVSGSHVAAEDDISFDGALTLTASTIISSGGGLGDISFNNTIDGTTPDTEDLSLTSGTGSISFSSAIGATVSLGNITINSANNVTANAIEAAAITQSLGTGTTSFNGTVTSTGAVSLSGAAFTINNTFQTTTNGLTVTNSGTFSLTSSANLTLSSGLTQSGTGSSSLNGSVVAGGAISFSGPVIAETGGSPVLSTAVANQPITFSNIVDGSGNLTLASGTAGITFNDNIGDSIRLGILTINSASTVVINDIQAAAISQIAGSASTTFNGNVDTNSVGGIDLNGTVFSFAGDITTTGSGPITITNSGLLTLSPGVTILSDGALTQDGSGAVSLGSNITTTNDDIYFNSSVTLSSATNLSSGSGGGTVTFNSTIDGTQDLSVTAGTGNVFVNGLMGSVTRLGHVTINSATDVTAIGISSFSLFQLSGTGTTTMNGNIDTNTATGLSFVGTNFFQNGDIVTTNGGSIIITNSGSITGAGLNVTNIDGSYIQNGPGPVSLGGTINTNNGLISFSGPITLLAPTLLNSGTGAGDIIISNVIDGANDLTLTAGSGSVTLSPSIGAITPLNSLTASGVNVTVADIGGVSPGVTGTTQLTASSNVNFTGTTYNANVQNYSSHLNFNMNAGTLTSFTSSGDNISFSGGKVNLSTGTNLTLNSAGGDITTGNIYAQSGNLRTLSIDAGAGDVQVGIIGVVGDSEFTSVSLDGNDVILTNDIISDELTFASTGSIYAGGNIYTTDSPIHFPAPVILTATRTFSSGSTTGGDITFNSTLDGDIDYTRSLTLVASTSDITFTGAIGATHPLQSLHISSANDVLTAAVTVNGLTQSSGTGTTTFGGTLNVNSFLGLSLTGTNFTINNPVNSAGAITIDNSGTLNLSGALSLSGDFSQSGAGPVNLFSNITQSSSNLISFAGQVSLGGPIALDSAGGNISFSNTLDGGNNLTLTAGTGNITSTGVIGGSVPLGDIQIVSAADVTTQSVTAASITQSAGAGTTSFGALSIDGDVTLTGNRFTFNNAVSTTSGGDVNINNSGTTTIISSANFWVDGDFLQTGVGSNSIAGNITENTAGTISFASPVTLGGSVAFDSAGGNITFSSTLNGDADNTRSMTLDAGAGDILFSDAVGITHPLNNLTISSADNFTTQAINASSITQNLGTGVTIFNGAITTSGASGIDLTATNITLNNLVTTTNTGPVTINNSGQLTVASAASFSVGGAFTQIGSGAVSLSANITKSAAGIISFSSPLTIGDDVAINSAGGNITFSSLIDGDIDNIRSLSVAAGLGSIDFNGIVGSIHPLKGLTIVSANNVTTEAITAQTIEQSAGTGTSSFKVLNLTGPGGLSLTGSAFTFNDIVTTTAGSVTMNNAGIATIVPGANFSVATDFTQSGTGATNFSSSIVAGQDVTFTGSVNLSGSPAIDTSASNRDIIFLGAVEGPGNLTLTAGLGDISFNSASGLSSRLGAVIVNSVDQIEIDSLRATSINLNSVVFQAIVNGTINTNSAGNAIVFVGNSFVNNGSIVTENGGSMVVTNAGVFSSSGPGTVSINGSFTQNGAGAVLLGGGFGANGSINFATDVTLIADTTLTAGSSGAALTFGDTLDGTYALVINNSNNGALLFTGNVGEITPLGDITVSAAGDVTFPSALFANSFNLQSSTGTALLYGINSLAGNMDTLDINAQEICFAGTIYADNTNFKALGSILNCGAPTAINSTYDALFNALGGNVGSLSSPILVYTSGQIIAGSTDLADFNGVSGDNTVHGLSSNMPNLIIFNGVVIYPIPLPPPPPPPVVPENLLALPGADSSFFTLADDFFFKNSFFLRGRYMYDEERKLMYYLPTLVNRAEH